MSNNKPPQPPTPSPELYNLVQSHQLYKILGRCMTHPTDVHYHDPITNYTPLHELSLHCASGRMHGSSAGSVAKAILRAAENSSIRDHDGGGWMSMLMDGDNEKGLSPLHCVFVTRKEDRMVPFAVEDLVVLFLFIPMDVVRGDGHHVCGMRKCLANLKDVGGNTPLHLFCKAMQFPMNDTLYHMVCADPGVILMKNDDGDTPLSLIVRNIFRFSLFMLVQRALHLYGFLKFLLASAVIYIQEIDGKRVIELDDTFNPDDEDDDEEERHIFEGTMTKLNIIHNVFAIPPQLRPPGLIQTIMKYETKSSLLVGCKEDDTKQSVDTPLHAVARSDQTLPVIITPEHTSFLSGAVEKLGIKRLINRSERSNIVQQEEKKQLFGENNLKESDEDVINALLKGYPQLARVRDSHGRLALTLAIREGEGRTWRRGGVRSLVNANATAILEVMHDVEYFSKLLPLILSLLGGSRNVPEGALNSIFVLVSNHPGCFEGSSCHRKRNERSIFWLPNLFPAN